MSNVEIAAVQGELAQRHSRAIAELVEALDAGSVEDCVFCGKVLGGFFGTFRWGIVNGQGECSECGFPYQYYHRHEVEGAIFYQGKEVAPAKELVLMAWVPNAEIPLSPPVGKGT